MLPSKILLIEKDDFYVDIIGTYVTFFLQQTLVSAKTVAGAHGRVVIEKPDLVLLDLAAGGGDPLEFAEQMRDDSQTKRIPIIAISSELGRRDEALGRGCAEFLPIPFRVHQLQALINQLFER